MNQKLLTISAPSHIHSPLDYQGAVRWVILALIPALGWGIYCFGNRALIVCLVSIATCLASEAWWLICWHRPVDLSDGSALLTGLLLGLSLPASVPVWLPLLAGLFAIILVKQIFGGLGYNIFNPALAARAFVTVSWPWLVTSGWLAPAVGTVSGLDRISGATPLLILKNPGWFGPAQSVWHELNRGSVISRCFFGYTGGSIGETSSLLLLLGGLFLLIIRVTDYRIVIGYLAAFTAGSKMLFPNLNPLFNLFSGGLFLGVFFMATDWVTSPVTSQGRWFFGLGAGALTIILRKWSSYPEGVSFAILIMNGLTPLIDRLVRLSVSDQIKR